MALDVECQCRQGGVAAVEGLKVLDHQRHWRGDVAAAVAMLRRTVAGKNGPSDRCRTACTTISDPWVWPSRAPNRNAAGNGMVGIRSTQLASPVSRRAVVTAAEVSSARASTAAAGHGSSPNHMCAFRTNVQCSRP